MWNLFTEKWLIRQDSLISQTNPNYVIDLSLCFGAKRLPPEAAPSIVHFNSTFYLNLPLPKLVSVQILVRLDCFSHSITMEVWKPARWMTAKFHRNEHTPGSVLIIQSKATYYPRTHSYQRSTSFLNVEKRCSDKSVLGSDCITVILTRIRLGVCKSDQVLDRHLVVQVWS